MHRYFYYTNLFLARHSIPEFKLFLKFSILRYKYTIYRTVDSSLDFSIFNPRRGQLLSSN